MKAGTTRGTVLDIITADGKYDTPTHSVSLVGTSSTLALAANEDRKYALFINDSDTVIYLKFGSAAAISEGIRLNPGGGSYEINRQLANLYDGNIYAISSAAGKILLVLEGV